MPGTAIHPGWKREQNLTFEVSETAVGWEVILIAADWKQPLEVLFATEEHATKAGQTILDYSYGPAAIDLSNVKVKPKEDEKPKTRKAPGKRKSTKSESAGAVA